MTELVYDRNSIWYDNGPTRSIFNRYYPRLLAFDMGTHFNCCGAQVVYGLSQVFISQSPKELWEHRAKFLKAVANAGPLFTGKTWYMIATTSQLGLAGPNHVLTFLLELGAKEVDKRPNQVHGPNDMHLLVWSPKDNKTKIEEYIHKVNFKWEIKENPHNKSVVTKVSAVVNRDSRGRFVRKPT